MVVVEFRLSDRRDIFIDMYFVVYGYYEEDFCNREKIRSDEYFLVEGIMFWRSGGGGMIV